MTDIRIDDWNGYKIRFVYIEEREEWYAVLKDVCDALNIKNARMVRYRIPLRYLEKVNVKDDPRFTTHDVSSTDVMSEMGAHSHQMIVVNNKGIYNAFMGSRKLEAQKFVEWMLETIDNVRSDSGYGSYEAMSFAEAMAAKDTRTIEEIIASEVEAIWKMRYWWEDKWWIEYTDCDYITLKEYCDEFVSEEISEEVYLQAYRKMGGQV